jgi:hypothetical protein
MEFKGFVGRINQKNAPDGSWTLYSTKIQKPDGSEYDQWVSFGFEPPAVKEGDYVKILTKTERGSERAQEVKKLKNPPERPAPPQRAAGTGAPRRGGGGGNFKKSPTNPEDVQRISYASARTAAIDVVKMLIDAKALPLSKADSKAGETKRFAEIMAAIDKFTVQFQKDGVSLRILESIADARAVETKKPAPLPDSEEEEVEDEEEETEEEEEEEEEVDEEEEE